MEPEIDLVRSKRRNEPVTECVLFVHRGHVCTGKHVPIDGLAAQVAWRERIASCEICERIAVIQRRQRSRIS